MSHPFNLFSVKLLSHISQAEHKATKSTSVESKKACYKGFAKDGHGNTRLKPISYVESHLDYLRIKIEDISPENLEPLICYISKDFVVEMDKPWSPGGGAKYFSNKIISGRGVRGGFDINEENGMVALIIDLPGEYFEGKTVVDQWRLCTGLKLHFGVRATRIDIAIDDPSYLQIPIQQMVEACNDGHNFGFKKIGYHSSGFCGDKQDETYTFGSRDSGKYVRVYDHEGECLRFEAEMKRGYAEPIFETLASMERPEGMSNEDWEVLLQQRLSSITVGALDFRDRGDRQDKSRAGVRDSVRLPFYQKFIDFLGCEHYRIKLEKPSKSIQKAINWFKKQCSPTLSMIEQGLGKNKFDKWLESVLTRASERLDNQKEIWVKEMQSSPQVYAI